MRLYWHESGEVRAESTYAEKDIPKSAGFRWNKHDKFWWTCDLRKAIPLAEHADEQLRAKLEEYRLRSEQSAVASRAVAAQVDVPAPEGLAYMPHQRAAIAYAGERAGTMNADEMGLGKTISALGTVNSDASIRRVLVVCPAMLKINWLREAKRWLVRPFRVLVVASGRPFPDGLAGEDPVLVIVNYELLRRHNALLEGVAWDLVVLDEAHFCKNYKAERTKLATRLLARGRRRLALTGTPVLAAPRDLVEVLAALDPGNWGDRWGYLYRYCDATGMRCGYDFSGARNLDELQARLRETVMVRRLKSEVLNDLPPKTRQVIVLERDCRELRQQVRRESEAMRGYAAGRDGARSLMAMAKRIGDEQGYLKAVASMRTTVGNSLAEIARLRRETARIKLPHVVEHVRNSLAQTAGGKIVVFAHHVDILQELSTAFRGISVLVYGGVPAAERQEAVDRFQDDAACQVFVAGIEAAGVGITLTASSHVVFAELAWSPAKMSQAEDRLHRIGQQNAITVQHMVVDGSIDAHVARVLMRKQAIIDRCLDTSGAAAADDEAGILDELCAGMENDPGENAAA